MTAQNAPASVALWCSTIFCAASWGGVGTSMSIRNKDGIKAQIASDPAIGVHAVLSLHAGDDQAGHVACLKLLQQIGACKGAWAVFFEHNLTAVQLQFGCELGQWAAWANGRSHGTDVTSQKNWRSRTAGLCHQGVDGVMENPQALTDPAATTRTTAPSVRDLASDHRPS